VAEFDGLFDNAVPTKPEDFTFKVHGTPDFILKVNTLNRKYDVFSTSVRAEPADVTPMEVNVDLNMWNKPANAGPPRKQSLVKEKAIIGQVTPLLSSRVIQPSTQPYYSQVHMVPKVTSPTEPADFRFCVDLRGLNNCTENISWPLPNIPAMLTRIGQQKPKLFAKLDLTSGYHQFPLHENSWKFFAFICFLGIYEWLRCVMGGKGVGAHFQKTMALEVLVGLIYIILELYLDDIIVFADTEEQFLERLEAVYIRLKSKRITLNPKKCEFGLNEIEFVGHTINSTRISFSREKLQEVVTFRAMATQKELRSFLGLGNYFRDHVLNYSELVHNLHQLVNPYHPRLHIAWTPELLEELAVVKRAINDCPRLFFVDDHSKVIVHTDASDYAIGAYLFQRRDDGAEYPIGFMSKSLIKEQLKWSTPEKECWAIIYAIRKWHYLFEGVHFVLMTDHANLTFLHSGHSAKVTRWRMELQDYDFELLHIPGRENIVADAFSRMLEPENEGSDTEFAEELPARVLASLAPYFDQTYHPEDWTPDFIEGDAPYCVGEESLFNEDILSTEKNSTSTSAVESLLQLQRSEIGVVEDHLSLFALSTPTWTSEWASSKTPLDHKIYEAIKTVHNSTAGHAGVDRTCIRLVDQGVQWKGMRQAVRQFIKECPSCQLMSFIKIAVHTHPFTAGVYGPWERVNIDTIGPLPEDELGYKFIIVIIDCFSRFLELHPAKDATAAAAADALYQTFGRFGSPQEILSDNGSQYVNEVITHFTEHIGVDHMLTMAYSHEENTIVERANKETMRHIRDIVFDRRVKNR